MNRFGLHTLEFPLAHLKPKVRTGYMACVRTTTQPGKAQVYPIHLWDRPPVIQIPLRPQDADVPLDLQELIDKCYRNGGYEGTLDYAADPEPPLAGAAKEWANTRLIELGLRRRKKPAPRKPKRKKS